MSVQGIEFGNVDDLAVDDWNRGWIMGHHVQPEDSPRRTQDLSIKWGKEKAGSSNRATWAPASGARTIVILISGAFELEFEAAEGEDPIICTVRPDQYVLDDGTRRHRARYVENCHYIVIRWPSTPGKKV